MHAKWDKQIGPTLNQMIHSILVSKLRVELQGWRQEWKRRYDRRINNIFPTIGNYHGKNLFPRNQEINGIQFNFKTHTNTRKSHCSRGQSMQYICTCLTLLRKVSNYLLIKGEYSINDIICFGVYPYKQNREVQLNCQVMVIGLLNL